MKYIVVILCGLVACNQPKEAPAEAASEGAAAEVEAAPAPAAEPGAMAIPEREADGDRVSKNGHLEHKVGEVSVDVRFGKPLVKEREIWGALVPYGEVWRTGANEATTLAVDKDVTIEGQALPAGVYSVFTIPNESEWTVIVNKTASQWGAYKYDAGQDVLRVTVTPTEAEHTEAMDVQGSDTGIVLRWEKVAVPVTIAPAG